MNLQYLRYAIEVEKAGSISKAAENLYMNQPNLSKAIRELESEIGVKLFKRTTKGISSTTDDGRVFIDYAKSILAKFGDMQAYFQSPGINRNTLRIAIPRASYIAEAFALFLEGLREEDSFNISFLETDSMEVIASVSEEGYDFGIIRCRDLYESVFNSLLREKELIHRELLCADSVIIISRNNELAEKDVIEPEDLHGMTEIINDDFVMPNRATDSIGNVKMAEKQKRVFVYERGSQFDILSRVPGTYMWVSPMPRSVLERNSLVQKNCSFKGMGFKDVLIYRKEHILNKNERMFLEKIELVKGCILKA